MAENMGLPESQHACGKLPERRVGLSVQAVADVHPVWLHHLGRAHILAIQAHESKEQVVHHCRSTQDPETPGFYVLYGKML